MSVRSKIGSAATALALIAVVGIWTQARESDDNYVLGSKWSPESLPAQLPVMITISIDGYPLTTRIRRQSPYQETMTAAPGALITLTVTSEHPSIFFMDCIIMRNGRSVPSGGYNTIPHPGTVKCVA